MLCRCTRHERTLRAMRGKASGTAAVGRVHAECPCRLSSVICAQHPLAQRTRPPSSECAPPRARAPPLLPQQWDNFNKRQDVERIKQAALANLSQLQGAPGGRGAGSQLCA